MELLYRSTRGAKEPVTASKAILQGLAEDGGLFVPDSIPKLTCSMEQLAGMTYQETAYEVMKLFLTDYTEEELKYCINSAYEIRYRRDRTAGKGGGCLLSGAVPRGDHRIQGYGTFYFAVSDDYCSEEESGEK